MSQAADQAAAASSPPPLRINSLSLRDFRAFGGDASTAIDLGGGNTFIYGENGAGKTSIFRALQGIFARRPSPTQLAREKNVFSGQPDNIVSVEVTFNDEQARAIWSTTSHPGRAPGVDARVARTAQRAAMLDYRALLDTNYLHGERRPNLFNIAIEHLLSDYPLAGGDTVGELWRKALRTKPNLYSYDTTAIDSACQIFNDELHKALASLKPLSEEILKKLDGNTIELDDFEFNGVHYSNQWLKRDRLFLGQELYPQLRFRNQTLEFPQLFLNEARLSALALSIYLGGRLACTPTATPEALKLMVLDDVLIGLDLSNRLPILDVLKEYFADWQIVLLTHDRVWFDMARAHLRADKRWSYIEIFEAPEGDGKASPIVRNVSGNVAAELLSRAEKFLAQGHSPAAANYTRVAYEQALKEFCDGRAIPVRYRIEPRQMKLEELLNGVREFIKRNGGDGGKYGNALAALELYQQAVLNPLSHAGSPDVLKLEVRSAISAVRTLLQAMQVK